MPTPWQPPDLDEIRPDLFVVNNEKVRPFLRGEGEREGRFFRLQSSRREGWIARLRMAGFNVRTLADRIDALKEIRPDVELGPEVVRALVSAREQWGAWDPERLRWRDLPVENVAGERVVLVRINEPMRRRKSRAGGDFFIAVPEHTGRAGLRPVKETEAVLHAYALMATSGRPAVLRFTETEAGPSVPADQALLPEPHRDALDFLALDEAPKWTFGGPQTVLAEEVFRKLGIELAPTPASEQH